jgi:hypothetical protein
MATPTPVERHLLGKCHTLNLNRKPMAADLHIPILPDYQPSPLKTSSHHSKT